MHLTADFIVENILSVFRGQANDGLGEGPELPIIFGEQYLLGTSKEIYQNQQLLKDIRPWITLDSSPKDHQIDNLEAWSCFCEQNYQIIVRMVFAGRHNNRVAYFSHARCWPMHQHQNAEFDIGLALGFSAIFDHPTTPRQASDEYIAQLSNFPKDWKSAIENEQQTTKQILGYLLQTLFASTYHPLVIAAPLKEFVQGAPLFYLIAFARKALPLRLRDKCSIRIHTRQVQNFINNLNCRLIVLPEDICQEALFADDKTILLNRQGECISEQLLETQFINYAEQIISLFLHTPNTLADFSRFIDDNKRLQIIFDPTIDLKLANSFIRLSYAYKTAIAENSVNQYFHLICENNHCDTSDMTLEAWQALFPEKECQQLPETTLHNYILDIDQNGHAEAINPLRQHFINYFATQGKSLDADFSNYTFMKNGEFNAIALAYLLKLFNAGLISENKLREQFGQDLLKFVSLTYKDASHRQIQKDAEKTLIKLGLTLNQILAEQISNTENADSLLVRLGQLLNKTSNPCLNEKGNEIPKYVLEILNRYSATPETLFRYFHTVFNSQQRYNFWGQDLARQLIKQLKQINIESNEYNKEIIENAYQVWKQLLQTQTTDLNTIEVYLQLARLKFLLPDQVTEFFTELMTIYQADISPEITKILTEWALDPEFFELQTIHLVNTDGTLLIPIDKLKSYIAKQLAEEILCNSHQSTIFITPSSLIRLLACKPNISEQDRHHYFVRIFDYWQTHNDISNDLLQYHQWQVWAEWLLRQQQHHQLWHKIGLDWLCHPIWQNPDVDLCFEDWQTAINLIKSSGLEVSASDIEQLFDRQQPKWPISPFRHQEQLESLLSLLNNQLAVFIKFLELINQKGKPQQKQDIDDIMTGKDAKNKYKDFYYWFNITHTDYNSNFVLMALEDKLNNQNYSNNNESELLKHFDQYIRGRHFNNKITHKDNIKKKLLKLGYANIANNLFERSNYTPKTDLDENLQQYCTVYGLNKNCTNVLKEWYSNKNVIEITNETNLTNLSLLINIILPQKNSHINSLYSATLADTFLDKLTPIKIATISDPKNQSNQSNLLLFEFYYCVSNLSLAASAINYLNKYLALLQEPTKNFKSQDKWWSAFFNSLEKCDDKGECQWRYIMPKIISHLQINRNRISEKDVVLINKILKHKKLTPLT